MICTDTLVLGVLVGAFAAGFTIWSQRQRYNKMLHSMLELQQDLQENIVRRNARLSKPNITYSQLKSAISSLKDCGFEPKKICMNPSLYSQFTSDSSIRAAMVRRDGDKRETIFGLNIYEDSGIGGWYIR